MGTAGQSITLANSIIGVGILAIPFCFQQCGVLLAALMLLLSGLVSRLSCYFLLKAAIIARRTNFEFLAFQVFGPAGKLAVEMGIIGFLMGTCIAYFVVVGDLGPQIISKMFNINQSDVLRTSVMVIVSVVCVLPLGLLRNVDSLSNVSAATIGFYFCLVLKVIAEAASQLLAGDWHTKMELWKPAGVLQCVPIFSMALFCQTQLFEIFESLPTLSLEKMSAVSKNAINICSAVYLTLGLFGYIAFGSQPISGNVLVSLSPTMASDVIKLGFVMSLAFSFPLIIFPCRASLYSLMYKKGLPSHHDHIINHSIPEGTFRCITVAIIMIALLISLMIPNIELVLGLVGSTIGVLICVVFPAACFINVTFKNTSERVLAKVILVMGLITMILGTYANLQAAEIKLDRYDNKHITQERIDEIVEEFFEAKKLVKSEDVLIKPEIKSKEVIADKDEKQEIPIKEFVVQPPNPVPPESRSNEKPNILQDNSEQKLVNGIEIQKVIEGADVKGINSDIKLDPNKLPGDEKLPIKPDITKQDETPSKISQSQDKIDLLKQQALIETMKQHGEEQQELIKEQKEILDEIKKTKQELQQQKNDKIENEEAKKIAVESIQKIANIAIQSLGGVTEKSVEETMVKSKEENLEKIADNAMKEIAKKAVETIEAIKESNGNLQNPENEMELKKSKSEIQSNQNLPPKESIPYIKQNNHNSDEQNFQNRHVAENNKEIANQKPLDLLIKPQNSIDEAKLYAESLQRIKDIKSAQEIINNLKSQARGKNYNAMQEESQPEKINMPILMALNQKVQDKVQNGQINKINQNLNDEELQLQKHKNLNNERQKREVIDCADKTFLTPEDKEICKAVIDNKKNLNIALPDIVDLGESSRNLKLDNAIHIRSLKSIANDDESVR